LNNEPIKIVLVMGSGVDALRAQRWDRTVFRDIVAINNAWQICPDWSYLIHPEDFLPERMPPTIDGGFQQTITAAQYIPIQNSFGGVVYAGATMAFTAGYWALGALRPDVLAFVGCDMIYEQHGPTHFYGKGTPDPLRSDITLQSLEAKSARLMSAAASLGCVCLNLSSAPKSRLLFPTVNMGELNNLNRENYRNLLRTTSESFDQKKVFEASLKEKNLSYTAASGRYWEESERFDPQALYELDQLWLSSFSLERRRLVA
jgi:hypothetical protein